MYNAKIIVVMGETTGFRDAWTDMSYEEGNEILLALA